MEMDGFRTVTIDNEDSKDDGYNGLNDTSLDLMNLDFNQVPANSQLKNKKPTTLTVGAVSSRDKSKILPECKDGQTSSINMKPGHSVPKIGSKNDKTGR